MQNKDKCQTELILQSEQHKETQTDKKLIIFTSEETNQKTENQQSQQSSILHSIILKELLQTQCEHWPVCVCV